MSVGEILGSGQPKTARKGWQVPYLANSIRSLWCHYELVLDLSTVTFIRCLKRFSARRGLPKRTVSETFKAAAKAIETMLNQEDLKDYLMNLRIEWNFDLERAPYLFDKIN